MTTDECIAAMTDRIVRDFNPIRLILFGSAARGEADRHSDIDILVVLARIDDKHQTAVAIRRVLSDIPAAKDILVTTPDEIATRGHLVGTVLRPALREGKVLYERQ